MIPRADLTSALISFHCKAMKKQRKKKRGNVANLHPFKAGKGKERDPRIWMGGRPNSFEKFRTTLKLYLNEPTKANRTRLEDMINRMTRTKGERKTVLEYAFGKVPDSLDITTQGEKIGSDAAITDRAITTLADAIGKILSGKS